MSAVSGNRWQAAQGAENEYWDDAVSDPLEFGRITHEKVLAVQFAQRVITDLPSLQGPFVEIGVGPVGVGCIHFMPGSESRELVGVDPIQRVKSVLPGPLAAMVAACETGYTHHKAMGEETGLPNEHFTLAVCYNVLDHCQAPLAVLEEIFRIVQPGGWLLLGVDVRSWIGLAKYHLLFKHLYPESIQVRAHPFRFTVGSLDALTRSAGFDLVDVNTREREWWGRIAGRGFRRLIVARRP